MGLKRVKRRTNKWFSVGEYYCPDAASITDKCVKKVDVKKTCKGGTGYVHGKIATKGRPSENNYYKPDVVGSWCWNKENNYCKCDCSSYTNQQSCNSGYLEIESENCGPNCYCWGCHWE